MSMSESVTEYEWECDWVFWGSSSLLSSPHLFICNSWVASGGGTDSGTKASPPSLTLLQKWHQCEVFKTRPRHPTITRLEMD